MKQMDNMLFQQNQTMDEIKNRLNCIESGYFAESGTGASSAGAGAGSGAGSGAGAGSHAQLDLEQIKHGLAHDSDFVSGIVDNIMVNSNLSEIIEQIDTVQTENQELRDLLYAQQKTINEMNVMLLKIISQSLNQQVQAAASTLPLPLPLPSPMPTSVVADMVANADDANADDANADDANADADDADDANADANSNIQLVVIDAGSNMQSVD